MALEMTRGHLESEVASLKRGLEQMTLGREQEGEAVADSEDKTTC